MKKLLIFILLFSFCLTQNNNKKNRNRKLNQTIFSAMGEEAKMSFFQTQKLSPERASVYQLVLPVPFLNLGYSYSNNWKKGTFYDIALVAILIGRNKVDEPGADCWTSADCDDEKEKYDVVFGVITLFKVFKANQLADAHNKKLFKKLFGVKKPKFSYNYLNDKKTSELSLSFPLN